jgi:hypothetical protein
MDRTAGADSRLDIMDVTRPSIDTSDQAVCIWGLLSPLRPATGLGRRQAPRGSIT